MENIIEVFTCTNVTDESPKAKPQCKICPNAVFDNKPLLTKHINMYHKKDDKYACHKCDDTFINFSTLTQHYTRHHSQPSTSITGEASTRDTYECKICPNAVFHNKTLLMQHNKKYHKKDGKYACHKCDHTYKSITSLTNHYINEHSQPLTSTGLTGEASTIATYKCNICDVCYEDNYSLSEHKKETHMIYTCDKCNYKNKDFTSFTQHMKEDHPQPTTSTGATGGATTRAKYQCEICNKYDFEKQTSLDSHIKKDHMKYVCDQCESTHKYFSRLTRHFKAIHAQLSTNTDETDKSSSKAKHSCKICYDVFENRHSLSSHIKKHHKNYVCHKCTCRCKTFTMLTKHVKTCEHPQPSTSTCITDEASTMAKYQCKVCYCICENKESLKVHKKVHILYICNKCDYENKDLIAAKKHGRHKHSHPSIRTDITDKASTRIEFRCNKCDASFKNQLSLSLHKKGHYTIYACTYCTYIDKALNNVTQHVKLEHPQPLTSTGVTGESSTRAKYQCKICYNVYEKKKSLNSHIRVNHKYYACNKCTYICETFTTLMKHVKTCGHPQPSTSTSITDEASTMAKYQCKICGESCRSTETLEMHYYNCHKKDNKFACTKCIYTGIKLDHVVTHIRSFHSSTSIFCVVCEKWFTTKYEYTTHQRVHKDLSELDKFDCPKCNKKYKYFSALEAHYNRMHFSRSV